MPSSAMLAIIFQEGIKALLAACAGILAAWIGLNIYFRQKEYELIKQRYLENSLDIITAELELRYNVLSHNWHVCLDALQRVKINSPHLRTDGYQEEFVALPEIKFLQSPHLRLQSLTKTDAYKKAYLNALINFQLANDFITKEIPSHIEKFKKGELKDSPEEFHSLAMSHAKTHVLRGLEHRKTIDSLHALTAELESINLGRKDISTFANRNKVKKIIEDMTSLSEKLIAENRPA